MSCVIDMSVQYCNVDGIKEKDPWCSTLEVRGRVARVAFRGGYTGRLSVDTSFMWCIGTLEYGAVGRWSHWNFCHVGLCSVRLSKEV